MTSPVIPDSLRELPPIRWDEELAHRLRVYALQELGKLHPEHTRPTRDRHLPTTTAEKESSDPAHVAEAREAIFLRIDMNLLNPTRRAYSPEVSFETVAYDLLRNRIFMEESERARLLDALADEWTKEVAEIEQRFGTSS